MLLLCMHCMSCLASGEDLPMCILNSLYVVKTLQECVSTTAGICDITAMQTATFGMSCLTSAVMLGFKIALTFSTRNYIELLKDRLKAIDNQAALVRQVTAKHGPSVALEVERCMGGWRDGWFEDVASADRADGGAVHAVRAQFVLQRIHAPTCKNCCLLP
jgi:hypothetical protein